MIPVINAYWSGDSIIVVSRTPQGKRQLKGYPAECSCFLRKAEVKPEAVSKLRHWPRIKAWHEEGEWIRVTFRSWLDLKEATSPLRYDHPELGGKESLFERMGIMVYEADVYPVRRWLTENDCEIQTPRRCYLDLETDSRVPFSRRDEMRILSWAVTDDDGEWAGEVLRADTDAAERDLLEELAQWLDQYDQVCAWNGDRFDFPLLKARMKARGIEFNFNGVLWVDQMELFRQMNMHVSESGDEKQSVALGRVAHAVLGDPEEKEIDASKSWEYWEAGGAAREKLFKYNVADVERQRRIEKETGYLDLMLTICQVCNTIPDARGNNGTNFVEGYLLKMGYKEGLRFRTNWDTQYSTQFEGAFVMEPTRKGILHNVHVCDFSGMYPSIIQTWNISPETLRKDVVLREDPLARPAYLRHVALQEYPLPADCCQVPGGSVFTREPAGLVPRAIAELKRLRKYWGDKKAAAVPGTPEWHDADRKSNAYKVAANTFYGVLGAPTSRFYAKELAGSVTAAGRWLITKTIEAAEQRGMAGVYGDTDSVFIMDVSETVFREFVELCNSDLYPSLLKELQCPVNEIRIAYEKEFATLLLVGKKRYAAKYLHYKGTRATADSKPEIKGLEYKRGDSVKLARSLQYEVVMQIMGGNEDPEATKPLVDRWRKSVLEDPMVTEDFVLSKSLTRDVKHYARKMKKDGTWAAQSPHIEVARVLAARGADVGEGTRVEYFITDGSTSPLKALPLVDYTQGAEDRYYLWEELVWPPTQRVLECAFPGVQWDKLYGHARPPKVRAALVKDKGTPPKRNAPPGQGSLFG